ncbi:MAG TPA: ABC transporter ATP-binding protein [Mycobacteriales bacterium]|jgi:branched-chain amino acid transport system ATP-binding protein|nr:ABC transporter ATP-binding protein [Mycobacteriales bacterium]
METRIETRREPDITTAKGRDTILEVRDLVKHYGGVKAVDGCSFNVPRGKLIGLIGPNGAGKSTVVETLSGIVRPDAGKIVFDGAEIQGLPPHKIFRTGMARCFQLARVWPLLSVLENMLVAAPTEGRDTIRAALFSRRRLAVVEKQQRQQALETLERYGLFRLRNDYAFTLSGGQKRLLEFARIAMARPKLALLDEPMAGVNPVLQVQIEEGIGTFLASGMTVLLIEHNLGFIERMCDEVIVMVQGRVAAIGNMTDLRNNSVVQEAYLGGGAYA